MAAPKSGRTLRFDEVTGWGWHNVHDWIPDPDLNAKPGPVILDGSCRAGDNRGQPHRFAGGYCVNCGVKLSEKGGSNSETL